jgi:spermidine synthase
MSDRILVKRNSVFTVIYIVCFLSGGAALMYEIVWFRSLSLIFGGSHLAITTTVSVFMLGLAFGSWISGRMLHKFRNLLMLYGMLELGIALFAGVFYILMIFYPPFYFSMAKFALDSRIYLTFIRVLFATIAMIVPTTLMGATIPILTSLLAKNVRSVGGHLSFLYGFNTFGAVAGATAAGFFLLRVFPISGVMFMAMAINVIIGAVSIIMKNKVHLLKDDIVPRTPPTTQFKSASWFRKAKEQLIIPANAVTSQLTYKLVFWGIGISGFCALGYEVLWTRILILFLDASTYSFTIMLVAFLVGISVGGMSYGFFWKLFFLKRDRSETRIAVTVTVFGITQLLIGLTTFLAMNYIIDLPSYSISLSKLFSKMTGSLFSIRQFSHFSLAFTILFIPAFLMGLAVPLAGKVHAHYKNTIGQAVGEIIAYNTTGAVLGAAISGFVLIYLVGIEKSFLILSFLNIGLGVLVIASLRKKKLIMVGLMTALFGVMIFFIYDNRALSLWDKRYLATYTFNKVSHYMNKEDIQNILNANEILYYGEGVESIVSSVQANNHVYFRTNGRVEASTEPADIQNQYMLGHLPMLLHKNPMKVLVIGMGSGMTSGAVSVHSNLESLTVVEIEPNVLGVARTFGPWNHFVVDNSKLRVIFNDARNFLMTSEEKFDVITADPIHPTWRGSGYLYTTEYFRLAAEHLTPGGIMCQWLPLYQLSIEDVQSIVRTFAENFKYVMAWLTLHDIQLLGSNEPILIDEMDIQQRMSEKAVVKDLQMALMDSTEAFFTYFLAGTEGLTAFSENAVLNTDDNVHLEFSSPLTIGNDSTIPQCLAALLRYRGNVEPYLTPLSNGLEQEIKKARWKINKHDQEVVDHAHILYISNVAGVTSLQDPKELKPRLFQIPNIGLWKSLRIVLFRVPGKKQDVKASN